ncbi:MAG: hypothetical protein IRY99_09845 [Isosphaeraceae bacterium]|nr:hypothetical protein [Isosphaeraceae bacterium]
MPPLWYSLARFRDPSIPKLDNLRRAARAGLHVPTPTVWAWADDEERLRARTPREVHDGLGLPCIIRSGSPTEDTAATSNAGQFLSLAVREPEAFPEALARVVAALPRSDGRPRGVVFIQPLIEAERAGVIFFDGFYFEETSAPGTNADLTAGRVRGEVCRGHLQRGDPRSDWLRRLHRVFRGRIDVEWAETGPGERVVLQVRPALFPIRRCETLSLANNRETLGDPPSPWTVGAYVEMGNPVLRVVALADPVPAAWDEPYAIAVAERAWVNFSALFRLMDHWGLPRTWVIEALGGAAGGPLDGRYLPGRLLRKLPRLLLMAWACLATAGLIGRRLRRLDAEIAAARTLLDLQRVSVQAIDLLIQTNFALIAVIAVVRRLRRRLGLDRAARVVTQRMMDEYAAVAARPDLAERLRGLGAWLRRYSHRAPQENDLARPRFAELRADLRADLERGPRPSARPPEQPRGWRAVLGRPLFLADERREWFREALMRRFARLRARILNEAGRAVTAGYLSDPADVFFLRREDLETDPGTWRTRVADRRTRWERARRLELPDTADRETIEAAVRRAEPVAEHNGQDRFAGIGLGTGTVTGTALRATELAALLHRREAVPDPAVLVVSTLDPSWAIVFPRFAAVVAELGGELSHAAILLREAGIPGVLNAHGAFHAIADGDRVRVDPDRGEVVIEAHRSE